MRIRGKEIGSGSCCYIIAEIAQNHDQKKDQAIELIRLAAAAGVQAVKFQIFEGGDIVTKSQLSSNYRLPDAKKFEYWHEYLNTIMLPDEWLPELVDITHQLGMSFIGTPCSAAKARRLVDVGTDALKVASMDNNNTPFLEEVSGMKVPVIISGGMASDEEVGSALTTLGCHGRDDIVLLHCISNYPTKPEDLNLGTIAKYRSLFKVPVGFSDHSISNYGAFAAVALGAGIVEKHITLSRKLKGPDHFFSLEPDGLVDLVRGIREVEAGMSESVGRPDSDARKAMYRSIHVRCDVAKGVILDEKVIEVKRPVGGLEPRYYNEVIGRRAARDLRACEPVTWEDLE